MKKAMIVSGPTVEAIDPVRFISNRSSGMTGYYLAETARICGFEPSYFISGPVVRLPDSPNSIIQIESAAEMRQAVLEHLSEVDMIIMAAAVSDYRPSRIETQKIKKGGEELILHLVRNPDILSEIGRIRKPKQIVVGFAAETENSIKNATEKLLSKNVDMIVLNQIGQDNPAFGCLPNQVTFITRQSAEPLPLLEKEELARRIWQKIQTLQPRSNQE